MMVNDAVVTCFLLDHQCAIQPSCSCSVTSISCYYSSAFKPGIPNFIVHNKHYSRIDLDFNNQITVIQSHAFTNLSAINATEINMSFYQNQIYRIDMGAFYGIEHAVTSLDFDHNHLTHVPKALADLRVLKRLHLNYNPLVSLDDSVMSTIGESLVVFSFSLSQFSSFPNELQYLKKLQWLTADYIPFTSIDPGIFRAFETTLMGLDINHSQLERVPVAACHLTKLRTFYFTSNQNLYKNSGAVFCNCRRNLPSLEILSLYNNNLTSLSNISDLFPNLTDLKVPNNKLHQILTDSLPDNLTLLDLRDNMFQRIPSAINSKHTSVCFTVCWSK